MKRTRTQLKIQAKQALVGNYGVVIGTMLLLAAIYMVFCIPLYMIAVYAIFSGGSEMAFVWFVIIWYVLILIFALLFGIGILRVTYQVCMTGTAGVGDLFYAFHNHPMRFLGLLVLIALIQLLASVPGFIMLFIGKYIGGSGQILMELGRVLVDLIMMFFVSLQYTLSSTVLIDHPDYRIMESLRTSKELMKGNRWRYAVLMLSFIGVMLLGYLSLGVGFLWLYPYFQCTLIFFYMDLKAEHNPPVQAMPDPWNDDVVQEPTLTSETNLWP